MDDYPGARSTAQLLKAVLPAGVLRWLKKASGASYRFRVWPPVGFVRFGSLRRTTPISPMWPPRYGRPIDRFYIERFLAAHSDAIQGEVLEVGGLEYTTQFGGDRVSRASILHSPIGAGPKVTFVADLADAPQIPSARFDCVVLPQTLLFIYDVRAAVRTLHRILRPGGVALVTVPGISQSVPDDKEKWGQYWSFTDQSLGRLFGDEFGLHNVDVRSHGNVLTTTAFLHGLSVEDLRREELRANDESFPLVLTVRATRASSTQLRS